MARLPKSTREFVRRRADEYCEYCGKPEGFSPHDHQVDHIIAVQHGAVIRPIIWRLPVFVVTTRRVAISHRLTKRPTN